MGWPTRPGRFCEAVAFARNIRKIKHQGALSEHYGSIGRLAEYRPQFVRVSRSPGDDPLVFAIELETLARREFVDVDASVRLQLVRDRFIHGQAECSLRRDLDSVGPDTPIEDIVDRCRI